VLENSATDVVINIRGNRTYVVDGTLGVQLKKLGFDLGGGLSTLARPAGTFAPASHKGAREGASAPTGAPRHERARLRGSTRMPLRRFGRFNAGDG
jgi:hypothetical protein